MARSAPYVSVRVIGSVAPASRKQLIPTDRFCCSLTTTTTLGRFRYNTEFLGAKIEQRDVSTSMSPRAPLLGSLAVQSSSQSSQVVHVSPATCHNLSLFKGSSSFWNFFFSDVSASLAVWVLSYQRTYIRASDLLKEYRKLDDAVTTRINRTTAQFRDRDRLGASGKGSVQEQACAYLWKELVGARGRNPIITRRLDVFHGRKPTGNVELRLSTIA